MNAHASDKTRILALAAVATLGFGLLQGARLLDLNTGPYSPSPYALVGLAADGLTFLVVAVLSYVGRIDRAKPLFVTAVVVSSIYAVLVASGNTNDIALIAMQVTAGMGWSLSILAPTSRSESPSKKIACISSCSLSDSKGRAAFSLSTMTALTTVSAMSTASSVIKSRELPSLSVNPSRDSSLFFVSNFCR